MWATHAIGHIDRETKNDFIVTSGKKERGKDHPSQNDACEGKIAQIRYIGVQGRNLRAEGKNALGMSKINNPVTFLKEYTSVCTRGYLIMFVGRHGRT